MTITMNIFMNQNPGIHYEQVINLMKSIISLEYCLQYQIIPLNLEQSCLHLGMIDPQDRDALDFVKTITKALGYSLEIKQIDSYTHQLALAEYLQSNHNSTPVQDNEPSQASAQNLRDSAMTVVGDISFEEQSQNLDNKATIIAEQIEQPQKISKSALEDSKSTVYAPIAEELSESSISSQPVAEPISPQTAKVKAQQESLTHQNPEPEENIGLDPFLDFDLFEPSVNYGLTEETLQQLTPTELWQELFSKILDGSITKLYLEPDRQQGKIVWSPDGIIELSLDRVSLDTLQTLIKEIKTLAKIPLQPLEKTKKVAIEKHYHQERLQLHLDICPSQWGDNITINVLRGDALRLYEQKQMKKMSEQALSLTQKLAKTLNMMRTRFDTTAIGNLEEIQQVKQEIERQLILLTQWSE